MGLGKAVLLPQVIILLQFGSEFFDHQHLIGIGSVHRLVLIGTSHVLLEKGECGISSPGRH